MFNKNRQMFEWKPDEGKLVAVVKHLRVTLEEDEGLWLGFIHAGNARISVTRGGSQEAVRTTVEKRVRRLLMIEHGACSECDGVMYPNREGAMRCLTRTCERYKKKVP